VPSHCINREAPALLAHSMGKGATKVHHSAGPAAHNIVSGVHHMQRYLITCRYAVVQGSCIVWL
jgi:hypothetical protein